MSWSDFYRATAGRAPRELFVRAIELFEGAPACGRFAIDLGCGEGTETLRLLESGWRVLAVDQAQEAIDLLLARVPDAARERLSVQAKAFHSIELPPADFVYAGLSLFFCAPSDFSRLWASVSSAVRTGGVVAAHFLGERDSWAIEPDITSHRAETVRQCFRGFAVEHFAEFENDRPAFSGPKHWHLFEVAGRKL